MKRLVVAGLVIFLVALFGIALLWLFQDHGGAGASIPVNEKTVSTGVAPSPVPGEEELDPLEDDLRASASETAGAERRLATPAATDHDGPWIEGRVDLTNACEADPTLEVFAFDSSRSYEEMVGILEDEDGDDEDRRGSVLATGVVEADGRFRLPIQAEESEVFVGVRGRFLYSPSTVRVDPAASSSALLLVPERGSALTVRLAGRDDQPPGEVELVCSGTPPTMNRRTGPGEGPTRLPARVGNDGRCEVRALPADTAWTLTVMPERLAAQKRSIEVLAACEERTVDMLLERGAALSGRVVDESDSPVAGATVKALWRGQFFGYDDPELRETTALSDGSFRIEALPSGEVSLQASLEGLLASVKEKFDVPEEGAREGILLRMSHGGAIAGRVTWPDGRPGAALKVKVRVDLAELSGMDFLGLQRGSESKATTDDEGRFRATGLGKGPFVVDCSTARDEDEAESSAASAAVGDELAPASEAPAKSEEPAHRARASAVVPGTVDLLLVLQPPLGLWGRVVDPDGRAVTEFEAELHEVTGGMLSSVLGERRKEDFTDENGRFFFGDVAPGRWEIAVKSSAYATAEPAGVEMPATSETDPLLVTLVPTATVTGSVLSPGGEAVPGATVHERREGGGMMDLMDNERRRATAATTDEDGRFRCEGLLPGSVSLHAEATGWANGPPLPLEIVGGQTIADVELRVVLGGTLTGEVYDDDGEPAPGRMVTAQIMANFQQKMATTDAAGLFRMEHLPPGSWQVTALDSSADWSTGEEGFDPGKMLDSMVFAQVTIEDGLETHVVLGGAPEDPIHVHGRVTHMDEPYRGAMLSFYATGERPLESMNFTSVDERGEYEVVLEGAGTYIVSVSRITGQIGQQNTIEFSCEVPAVAEHRLDFKIPHGRISGRVLGPDRAPVAGARITLAADGVARSDRLFGGQYTEVQTAADGGYDVQGLRAGTYRVSAGGAAIMGFGDEPTTGRLTRGGLVVAEEQWLQDIDFHLEAPGSLEISVRDASGGPAAGATIFVRDAQGRISEAMSFHQTDSSGRCVYPGLAPGSYTALARSGTDATPESGEVTVRAGERASVEISLAPGAILWVRFRLDDGAEIPAHIQITDSAGRDVTALLGFADIQALYQNGAFSPTEHRIGPLHPGKYKVHAWTDDGKSARKNVVVEAGEREQRFTLKLETE